MAEGTYNPPGSNDNFNRSFILKNGIKIYGGFKGVESELGQRVYEDSGKTRARYKTILSGNYPNGDKIYHTVIASGISTAYLDGLEIEGSRNGYWSSGTFSVNLNSINANYGGAFYVVNSSPILKNVTIRNGLAQYAAGMYVTTTGSNTSLPILLHCRITNNQSSNTGSSLSITGASADKAHVLMIGGTMDLNLDAMGVLNIGNNQKATLVNVSIVNNKEAAVHSGPTGTGNTTTPGSGTGNFINCTITGNRGKGGTDTSVSLPNVVSIGEYYNSIIRNNDPQVMPALPMYNTDAPFYPGTISSSSPDIDHYPITSGGAWNSTSTIYNIFSGAGTPLFGPSHPCETILDLGNIIVDALKLDGNGNSRFNGSGDIKLGAIQ